MVAKTKNSELLRRPINADHPQVDAHGIDLPDSQVDDEIENDADEQIELARERGDCLPWVLRESQRCVGMEAGVRQGELEDARPKRN